MSRQRVFVILGVVFGLLLGALLVTHIKHVRRHRAAVAMVHRLGGKHFLDGYKLPRFLSSRNDKRIREGLQPLLPAPIKGVCIGMPIPDRLRGSTWRGFEWQPGLPLKDSYAFPTRSHEAREPASDADLAILRGFNGLEYIDIAFTDVTDAAIDDLCSLPRLQYLVLAGSKITPQGIAELRRRKPSLFVVVLRPQPPPVDISPLGPDRFLPLEVEQELLAP